MAEKEVTLTDFERIQNQYLKKAHSSMYYVNKYAGSQEKLGTVISKDALARVIASYPSQSDHMTKIGQAMIGPILVKLKYTGVVRNILLETPLAKGQAPEYDVVDKLGLAYILNESEGEVQVARYEGKRVMVPLFHVTSFPSVTKDDLYALNTDMVKYAKEWSEDNIRKQEDSRLYYLIDNAITLWEADPNNYITPDHSIDNMGQFTNTSFNEALSIIASHELEGKRIIVNDQDYYDIYNWSIDQGGWKFKDDVVYGVPIVRYAQLQMTKSIVIPQGTAYTMPDPEYVGFMPIRYSLDVVDRPRPEELELGWVMDELIGMMIVNPRGLVRIVKST